MNAKNYVKLHTPFSHAVLRLIKIPLQIVSQWWSQQSIDYFENLVENYKNVVMHILRFTYASRTDLGGDSTDLPELKKDIYLESALKMLKLLVEINASREDSLSDEKFHLPELTELVNLQKDFFDWIQPGVKVSSMF